MAGEFLLGGSALGQTALGEEITAAGPAPDTDQLATMQSLDRGFGQVRAARLGGDLQ